MPSSTMLERVSGCGCVGVVVKLFPSDIIIQIDVAAAVLKLLLTLKGLPQQLLECWLHCFGAGLCFQMLLIFA